MAKYIKNKLGFKDIYIVATMAKKMNINIPQIKESITKSDASMQDFSVKFIQAFMTELPRAQEEVTQILIKTTGMSESELEALDFGEATDLMYELIEMKGFMTLFI